MKFEVTFDGNLLETHEDGFADQGDALDAIKAIVLNNPSMDVERIKLWMEIPLKIERTVKVETAYRGNPGEAIEVTK